MIEVPDDFDRMAEAEIQEMFEAGKWSLFLDAHLSFWTTVGNLSVNICSRDEKIQRPGHFYRALNMFFLDWGGLGWIGENRNEPDHILCKHSLLTLVPVNKLPFSRFLLLCFQRNRPGIFSAELCHFSGAQTIFVFVKKPIIIACWLPPGSEAKRLSPSAPRI